MGNLMHAASRIVTSRPVTWLYLHVFPHVDRALLGLSRGWLSVSLGAPVLLLETTGARSGEKRSTPLVYATHRGAIVLIASNGGSPHNPAWYFNIRAHPQVQCTIRGKKRAYTARVLDGHERDDAWQRATEMFPGYATYAARAESREIPLIVLSPVASTEH